MEEEILKQAFVNHPFAIFAGIALCVICFFAGWALLMYGWPKFRK